MSTAIWFTYEDFSNFACVAKNKISVKNILIELINKLLNELMQSI